MTVKSLAVDAVAPEAAPAIAATGKAAGPGARKRAGRGMGSAPAAAPPAPSPTASTDPAPAPTSPGAGVGLSLPPAAVSSGSGFLLGVFAWAVGLAYLQGGSDGVRKFFAAKFLNKT